MHKLAHLDILRAVAILMVILVHVSQRIPGLDAATALVAAYGQMGVQLFFVVSAYTLCLSCERRAGDPVAHFYIRRLFRIAPLYFLGIGLYFTIRSLRGDAAAYTAGNVLANLTFAHGFVKSAMNSIVPGGWSIAVEMNFYLLFPLAFALMRWGARRSAWFPAILAALALACNIALQASIGMMNRNNAYYYNTANQLPVFAIGMAAYFALKGGLRIAPWLAASGFAAFTFAAVVLFASERPLAYAWLPSVAGIGFAFLLALFHVVRPSSRLLQRIGATSFSMYVLHFAFVWALAPAIGASGLPPALTLLAAFLMVAGCTFAASLVTERLVEARGIRWGERVIASARRRGVVRAA